MRALLSVTNKEGIEQLSADLHSLGIELVSTGGTARTIREFDGRIPVTEVTDLTGSPECLGGRLKTLDFRLLGGILFRDTEEDRAEAQKHDLIEIDLVFCNLYDFAGAVAGGGSFDKIVEKIDIGGPTMVRAAAKNWKRVAIVVDPEDYSAIVEELRANDGKLGDTTRLRLARKAFSMTASYEQDIDDWWNNQ